MRRFIALCLLGTCFGQTPKIPVDQNQQLITEVQLLKEQVAQQNVLLEILLHPQPEKHHKWKKALTVMDHLGSAASISSVLGVYKK